MRRFLLFLIAASFALPAALHAQSGAQRYELGQKLRAFERALEAQTDDAVRKRVLADLKTITFTFFSGQIGQAGQMLDKARRSLAKEAASPEVLWADSVSMMLSPRLVDTEDFKLTARLTSFYSVDAKMPVGVKLSAQLRRDLIGLEKLEYNKVFDVAKLPFDAEVRSSSVMNEGDFFLLQSLIVGEQILSDSLQTVSLVDKLKPRLKKIATRLEALKDKPASTDRYTTRRLFGILSDLSEGKTLETNYPAARLLGETEAVLDAIDKTTPYYGQKRSGDFYLGLATTKGESPVRLMAPDEVKTGKPLPLVIALHGAGGSENMFFDAYGDGKIVNLCYKRGWLLVTPRNGMPGGLIDAVDALYPVDRKRVFLVGHSMGAAQAVATASTMPGSFRAVAALGGGGFANASDGITSLPFFVGVGTEDFALSAARQLRDRLKKLDVKKIEFHEYDGAEHVSVVQLALKDVFRFFEDAAKP